jgi:hypothetical protein
MLDRVGGSGFIEKASRHIGSAGDIGTQNLDRCPP